MANEEERPEITCLKLTVEHLIHIGKLIEGIDNGIRAIKGWVMFLGIVALLALIGGCLILIK